MTVRFNVTAEDTVVFFKHLARTNPVVRKRLFYSQVLGPMAAPFVAAPVLVMIEQAPIAVILAVVVALYPIALPFSRSRGAQRDTQARHCLELDNAVSPQ